MSPITLVEFIETQSRMRGTGYKDYIYRIFQGGVKTDDALIVRHNTGAVDNLLWDDVNIVPGFFRNRREYGNKCHKMSLRYKLPMGACLAVGPQNCAELAEGLPCAREYYRENEQYFEQELFCCGVDRRKRALLVLFSGCSDALLNAIQKTGRKGSQRLANIFWSETTFNSVWNMTTRRRYNLPNAYGGNSQK